MKIRLNVFIEDINFSVHHYKSIKELKPENIKLGNCEIVKTHGLMYNYQRGKKKIKIEN